MLTKVCYIIDVGMTPKYFLNESSCNKNKITLLIDQKLDFTKKPKTLNKQNQVNIIHLQAILFFIL